MDNENLKWVFITQMLGYGTWRLKDKRIPENQDQPLCEISTTWQTARELGFPIPEEFQHYAETR